MRFAARQHSEGGMTGMTSVDETFSQALDEMKACLLAGDREGLVARVERFLGESADPQAVLDKALIPGMSEIGEEMARKEIFIPEVLMAAHAMQGALEVIRPVMAVSRFKSKGTIALGTVKGDVHDIGKNLVGYMLEGAGFRIVDLGINLDPEQFVEAIALHSPQVVGMSAMLTTTMQEMESVIRLMETRRVRHAVKVIVGGAPVSRAFALEIGADGYAEDAGSAIAEVWKLLGVN
jgi:5-methyltetrahydrofolate--homocysteine methyltransferase